MEKAKPDEPSGESEKQEIIVHYLLKYRSTWHDPKENASELYIRQIFA